MFLIGKMFIYCRGQCMVLIDAAKGCATDPPDLEKFPADFVVLSFYKVREKNEKEKFSLIQ